MPSDLTPEAIEELALHIRDQAPPAREQILSDIETVMTQPVQIRAPQFHLSLRYSDSEMVHGRDPRELMREFREPWFCSPGRMYIAQAEPEFMTVEVIEVRRRLAQEATPVSALGDGGRCFCASCIQYRFERLRVFAGEHYNNRCDCAACHRVRLSVLADLTRILGPYEPSDAPDDPRPVSRGDYHYNYTIPAVVRPDVIERQAAWEYARDMMHGDTMAERVRSASAPSVPDGWKRNRFEA